MSTFETALKFWWGPPKCWGARGACLICLIVNPPLTVIVNSTILSRLDYCHSILCWPPTDVFVQTATCAKIMQRE